LHRRSRRSRIIAGNIVIMGNAQSSDLTIRYIYNLSKADRIAKVLQEVLSGT